MTTYHFQFDGETGWEDIGAAVDGGEDPLVFAIIELRALYGGALPPGRYQAIEARSDHARWVPFELSERGRIVRRGIGPEPTTTSAGRPGLMGHEQGEELASCGLDAFGAADRAGCVDGAGDCCGSGRH